MGILKEQVWKLRKQISKYTSNKIRLLDDNGNLDLQGRYLINLGLSKSDIDGITLENVKIILNDFKGEVVN